MKMKFTFFKLLVACLIFSNAVTAQVTGDYRSVNAPNPTGGNWSDITKWERYNGSSWVAAAVAPTSADQTITIRTGDNIILDASVTADQLVVETGAFLSINAFFSASGGNDLTLNNGTGTDLTVNGTMLLRAFNVISGAGDILINGTFNWYSGTLAASTTTAAASVTNFDLDFTKFLTAALTNNGTINWATGASPVNITITNTTFTNNGTINEQFQGNSGFYNGGGTLSFVNNGTLNKTTTFEFANSTVPFTNTGTIKGVGGVNLNFATVTNSGIVSPGSSPGILNATEALISGQPANVRIEVVNGTGAGTGHDQLNLNMGAAGITNLSNASLTVVDFGTAPVQSYTIIQTAGTFSGTFASVTMPLIYTITYNPSSIVIAKTVSTLPAVWGDFTAISKNGAVALNWSTLQEDNTSVFVIEHSTNGREFTPVATISAKGNSATVSNYSFSHLTPNRSANNIYRIRLQDVGGKSSYSAFRSVRFVKGSVILVQATPNPVIDNLQLQVQENKVSIKIVDLYGRVYKTLNLQSGVHNISVGTLPSGMYQLIIYKDNKEVESQKLMKL